MGKSRLLYELNTHLNTGSKVHTITLAFSIGRGPRAFGENLPIEEFIGLRLLHRLGTEEDTLATFYRTCKQKTNIRSIHAQSVLLEYFNHLNPAKEPMDVILAIDYYHLLVSRSCDVEFSSRVAKVSGDENEPNIPASLHLLYDLVQLYRLLLTTQPFYESHNIFLTVILSGSYLRPLHMVFLESGNIPYEQLPLPLLRASDLREIVLETRHLFQPGCDPLPCVEFWKQLLSFGGWPLPTAVFLSEAWKRSRLDNIHWQTFTCEVLDWLSRLYTIWQARLPYGILQQLLTKSLLQKRLELIFETVIPTSLEKELNLRFSSDDADFWRSITWEGLARLGLCVLEPVSDESSSGTSLTRQYHLFIPPALAILLLDQRDCFRNQNKHWNQVLTLLKKMVEHWEQWDVFCRCHESLRGVLFYLDQSSSNDAVSSNQFVVLLHDFFPTKLFHSTLDGFFLRDSPNAVDPEMKTRNRYGQISKRTRLVLNAGWFAEANSAPVKKVKVIICSQMNYGGKKTKPLSLINIQKTRAEVDRLAEDDTVIVLCVVTNRPVSGDVTVDVLPRYTLVVHSESHDAYFGRCHPGVLREIITE